MRQGFVECYRGLMLLKNYCTLNVDGFKKITTKYDKRFGTRYRDSFVSEHVRLISLAKILLEYQVKTKKFFKTEALNTLFNELLSVYAKAFENGSVKKAKQFLDMPFELEQGWLTFRLGVLVGVGIALMITAMYLGFSMENPLPESESHAIFIVFRMVAMAILMLWLWGIDLYVNLNSITYFLCLLGVEQEQS